MLAHAHRRVEAKRAMLDLEVMTAIVSSLTRGGTPITRLQKALREQAEL